MHLERTSTFNSRLPLSSSQGSGGDDGDEPHRNLVQSHRHAQTVAGNAPRPRLTGRVNPEELCTSRSSVPRSWTRSCGRRCEPAWTH